MRWRALLLVLLLGSLGLLAWQTRQVAGVPATGPAAVRAENGLTWEDVAVGTGPSPSPRAIAVVQYTAWTAAGAVLASASEADPLRFTFGTGEALPAFEQGIADMRVGGRRRLWIPASLAYSVQGAPGVAPGTDLVFDVTLLAVDGAEEGPFPEGRNTVEP